MRVEGLISVIVPVYKVEKYISRCLDSIISQTYTKLEIILVDDGSPDNCGKICDEYAKKDSRIRVVHKANGGLSDARNVGLEIASGEYISFIDSDDWVEPNMIEILYDACVENNVKLSCCGRYDVDENYNKKIGLCPLKNEVVLTETMLEKMFESRETSSIVCDKLFHYTTFDEVLFPKGKIYEDMPTTYKCVQKAKAIALCPYPLYNYFHRSASITKMGFSPRIFDYTNHTKQVFEELRVIYPNIQKSLLCMRVHSIGFVLSCISMQGKETRRLYKSEFVKLKNELKSTMFQWKKIGIKFKVRIMYLLLILRLYRPLKCLRKAFE